MSHEEPLQHHGQPTPPHAERNRRTKAATDRKITQAALQIAIHQGISSVTIDATAIALTCCTIFACSRSAP